MSDTFASLVQLTRIPLNWWGSHDFTYVPTCVSHSWQGELAHRLIKSLYGLTNKKDAMKQIGKKYNRQEALRPSQNSSELEKQEVKEAATRSLENHHIISESRNLPVSLFSFVQTNCNDPATKVQSDPLSVIIWSNLVTGFHLKASTSPSWPDSWTQFWRWYPHVILRWREKLSSYSK